MSEKLVKNWIKLAKYDIKTADAMLKSRRYLYVAFTCQQAIEKLLKAIFVKKKNETPPYTHNLIRLAKNVSLYSLLSEDQKKVFNILNSYYIESRYTEEIAEISKTLKKEASKKLFEQTKEIFSWIEKKISL